MTSAPVLKAPKVGEPFKLYLAAGAKVIGAVLTQETERREYVITYLSQRLVDAETRYTFVEKLCLCLFYACTKQRYYLLSSSCVVACQTYGRTTSKYTSFSASNTSTSIINGPSGRIPM